MKFPSIRIEGAILAGDILDQIESGDVSGQKPTDFGLPSDARVKDEIIRAWADAQDLWRIFRRRLDGLKPAASATSETRNLFVVPLLGLLGYQIELAGKGEVVHEKNYPISHRVPTRDGFPVHIMGWRDSLDKKREDSGPRMSPHALVQEYLNLTEHLYALVTNGQQLRLLRDSSRLIKLSFLEFDLRRIFEEELFPDFALLYRLLHVSRMPLNQASIAESTIERYHQDSLDSGSRIREGLRDAVERVITAFGNGFLAHPDNEPLRQSLQSGAVSPKEYYQHLLRLIYRLLFLMVIEERGLVYPRKCERRLKAIYDQFYSLARLRRLAGHRFLADKNHSDLWLSLRATFRLFDGDERGARLGISPLAGRLFSPAALGLLNAAHLDNATLLGGLRQLSLFEQPGTRQVIRVNYGAMATEEFGSVYESLLELHPTITPGTPPHFAFKQAAGNERKTSGSYYTPSSLVECLLDSALDPVLEETIRKARENTEPPRPGDQEKSLSLPVSASPLSAALPRIEKAILALKVCDPACGSGHFLIAAAQRIARRLAVLRAGDEEPGLELLRHTLREVISHCIYGVDINPMSVELCKVGLWLEAMEAGKPLSFLDHHIRCGNSLLGATPALIAAGLPDDTFTAIEGDDRKACAALKRLNARERAGFGELFILEDSATSERLQQAAVAVENLPDDSVRAVEQKSAAFDQLQHNYDFAKATDLANLWCAAFVIRKRFAGAGASGSEGESDRTAPASEAHFHSPSQAGLFGDTFQPTAGKSKTPAKATAQPSGLAEAIGITSGHLHDFAKGSALPDGMMKEVQQLTGQYNFFHWHLAFPEVFGARPSGRFNAATEEGAWNSSNASVVGTVKRAEARAPQATGFDVILGNPPWERVKLQEKEWFAERRRDIADTSNAATRKRRIEALKTEAPALHAEFQNALRQAEGESHVMRNSGLYPLCGRGDINLYAIFAERMRNTLNQAGRVGAVLPSGIATDDTTKFFFQDLVERHSLNSLFDFENRLGFFPAVDSRMKFCLLTSGSPAGGATQAAEFVFFAHRVDDLSDARRRFTLSPEDIARLNPDTRTCPIFRSSRDAELCKQLYRSAPVFGSVNKPAEGRWCAKIPQGIFHQTNDAAVLRDASQLVGEGFQREPTGNWERAGERYVTMYEGRMIHLFTHRAASVGISEENSFRSGVTIDISDVQLADPFFVATSRYWAPAPETDLRIPKEYSSRWMLGFKDVTSATNERTMIAAVIPRTAVVYSVRVVFLFGQAALTGACLLAEWNSFSFDFIARQKTPGNHITDYIIRQLPSLPPTTYGQPCPWATGARRLSDWILPRVLELTYTAWDLEAFAQDCGWSGPPFRWDEERRFLLRCELDAAFFHLYGLNRDDTAYILDTFPIVKRKDEARHGHYRTQRVILELYDALKSATETGQPYQTRLNPPPADPRCCHPPRASG